MSTTQKLGIFMVANKPFAIKVESVSEVVPFRQVSPIFTSHKSVIGGLNLRGWIVPVVDIHHLMHTSDQVKETESILIVNQDQKVLGIGIDEVVGMHDIDNEQFAKVFAESPLISGSFHFPERDIAVSLFDCHFLFDTAQLPHVPLKVNQEYSFSLSDSTDSEQISSIIFRVGEKLFAVESATIFSTMAQTPVRRSNNNGQTFLGEVTHLNKYIPVLDFGRMIFNEANETPSQKRPSIILTIGERQVAFCIDEIIDVTLADMSEAFSKPPESFYGSQWFNKVLSTSAFTDGPVKQALKRFSLVFWLDIAYLQSNEAIEGVLGLCRDISDCDKGISTTPLQQSKQGLLYDMGAIIASDMAEVIEIVSTDASIIPVADDKHLAGVLPFEGETIAVYDFRNLLSSMGSDYSKKENVTLSNVNQRILVMRDSGGAFAVKVNCLLDVIQYTVLQEDDSTLKESTNYLHDQLKTAKFLVDNKPKYTSIITVAFLRSLINRELHEELTS